MGPVDVCFDHSALGLHTVHVTLAHTHVWSRGQSAGLDQPLNVVPRKALGGKKGEWEGDGSVVGEFGKCR